MGLHYGEIGIDGVLSYLDSIAGTEEEALFRPYIQASWGEPAAS